MVGDVVAERAVLAGIIRHGSDAYYDVADIINENSFTIDSNSILYKIVKTIMEDDDKQKIDIPTIYATAKKLHLSDIFNNKTEAQHLQAIVNFPVDINNVRKFGAVVGKLAVSRLLDTQLEEAQNKLKQISGVESYASILGIAEDAIFNFSSLINDSSGPEKLGSNLDDYLDQLEANPVDQIGISTGYSKYDLAIGGGLRRGTINIIGARAKVGKTLLSDSIGMHIAGNIGLPVLNLDTEMLKEDHQHRTLAMLSGVDIHDIESGKYSRDPDKKNKVREASKLIKKMNYYHECIGGMPFEEQLSIARRWLAKVVGLNSDNSAKPCVIIYDYIKLMTSDTITNNIQEYQALGFMMTGLHNFALRYRVPILAFIQLNRDGITKESTDAASGSDRIIWLCSNFTIYKKKSDEEIAEDGPENGNRKLVPIIARHGAGLDDGDYINMLFKASCGQIKEGKSHFEIVKTNKKKAAGFEIKDDTTEEDIYTSNP